MLLDLRDGLKDVGRADAEQGVLGRRDLVEGRADASDRLGAALDRGVELLRVGCVVAGVVQSGLDLLAVLDDVARLPVALHEVGEGVDRVVGLAADALRAAQRHTQRGRRSIRLERELEEDAEDSPGELLGSAVEGQALSDRCHGDSRVGIVVLRQGVSIAPRGAPRRREAPGPLVEPRSLDRSQHLALEDRDAEPLRPDASGDRWKPGVQASEGVLS